MLHNITGTFRLYWPAIMLPFLVMMTSAQADDTLFKFDLPSQPLIQSLEQFQKTTGINIVYAPRELENYRSSAIQGQYTPRQAIRMLLAEHRLNAEFVSDSMIAVKPVAALQQLPEMIVTGELDPDSLSPYNTRYLRNNSVTATRTNTPVMETPFSIQAVPQQVLRDQQAIRLDTAVQNVSGIIQTPTNGSFSDGFLIRGFSTIAT